MDKENVVRACISTFKKKQIPGDREDREAWHAAVHGAAKSQT